MAEIRGGGGDGKSRGRGVETGNGHGAGRSTYRFTGRSVGRATSKAKGGRKRKSTQRGGEAEDSGAESLAKAVDAEMRENCSDLAAALVKAAMEGNMSCAKIAITISERQWKEEVERQEKEKRSKTMGMAERWANEPVWVGREPEIVKAARLKQEGREQGSEGAGSDA
jgi:hypothetical protein